MPSIFIAVILAFLLGQRADGQGEECMDAISGIATACANATTICTGDCRAAYDNVFSVCDPQVNSRILFYMYRL